MKKISFIGVILVLSACTSAPIGASPTNVYSPTQTETSNISSTPPTPIFTNTTLPSTEIFDSAKTKEYVGLEYPPLPQDISEGFAVIIWDSDNYLLSLVEGSNQKMLWLSKMSHRDSDGKAYWIVKDTLIAPDLADDEMFYANGCLLHGVYDFEIVAAGKWDNDVYVSRFVPKDKILQAWRANLKAELFEKIDVEGIECSAEYQFK